MYPVVPALPRTVTNSFELGGYTAPVLPVLDRESRCNRLLLPAGAERADDLVLPVLEGSRDLLVVGAEEPAHDLEGLEAAVPQGKVSPDHAVVRGPVFDVHQAGVVDRSPRTGARSPFSRCTPTPMQATPRGGVSRCRQGVVRGSRWLRPRAGRVSRRLTPNEAIVCKPAVLAMVARTLTEMNESLPMSGRHGVDPLAMAWVVLDGQGLHRRVAHRPAPVESGPSSRSDPMPDPPVGAMAPMRVSATSWRTSARPARRSVM